MECKFQVGDMVVCVDDKPSNEYADPVQPLPVKGRIYTVRGFCTIKHIGGGIGVLVEEIIHPPDKHQCFHTWRFRPVRKTNIEALRQLVINPKVTT